MGSTAVVSFGRLNPVTIGHVHLAKMMESIAEKYDAPAHLFLSSSYDGVDSSRFKGAQKSKNPLKLDDKRLFVEDALLDTKVKVSFLKEVNTPFSMMRWFSGKVDNLIFVGDKSYASRFRLEDYNGRSFTYDSIEFIQSGQRDDSADDSIARSSATLLRAAVVKNDFETFEKFAGTKRLTEEMWNSLRYEMNLQ